MAVNFFSNKARAAAAASGSSKKPTDAKDEQAQHQPWVEK
jgi:replication factor C subunit 2/4